MSKVFVVAIEGKLNTAAKAAKYLRTMLHIDKKLEWDTAKIKEGYVFFDEQENNWWGAKIRVYQGDEFYYHWRLRDKNKEIIILNTSLTFIGAL